MNPKPCISQLPKRYLHRRVYTENIEDVVQQGSKQHVKQVRLLNYSGNCNNKNMYVRSHFSGKSYQAENTAPKTQRIYNHRQNGVGSSLNADNQKPFYASQDQHPDEFNARTLKHLNTETGLEDEEEFYPIKHFKNSETSRPPVKYRFDRNPAVTESVKLPIAQKNVKSQYQIEGIAGKGTFGVVYYGRNKQSGEKVAIKKVLQDKKYKNRELQILKQVTHINLLSMKQYYFSQQQNQEYLNVIMDYFPDNLYEVIKRQKLTPLLTKLFIYQTLRGLHYLAINSIAHRDIKPQNILVDHNTLRLVICDFGSAKKLVRSEPNLAYICSRCYRAPELIFGATEYSPQIDMWSLGCVIAQMVNGEPPFLGDSQLDQLLKIINVLGTPLRSDIREMNPNYDLKDYKKMPNVKPASWHSILKTDDVLLVDLVRNILQYSPLKRFSAAQALLHPYFEELSRESTLLQLAEGHLVSVCSLRQMLEITQCTTNPIAEQRPAIQKSSRLESSQKFPISSIDEDLNIQIRSANGPDTGHGQFLHRIKHRRIISEHQIPKTTQKPRNNQHDQFSAHIKTQTNRSMKRIVKMHRNCPEYFQHFGRGDQHKEIKMNEYLPQTQRPQSTRYEYYATDRLKTTGAV